MVKEIPNDKFQMTKEFPALPAGGQMNNNQMMKVQFGGGNFK